MSRQFASQAAQYFKRPHVENPSQPIDHPAAWYGSDMAERSDEWLIQFSADDIATLEAAARRCIEQGMTLDDLNRETFVLHNVAAKLGNATEAVSRGRGFCVFRGLPVERWGESLTSFV